MKSFLILAGSIAYISYTYATPTRVLKERDDPSTPGGFVMPTALGDNPTPTSTAAGSPDATPDLSNPNMFFNSSLWDLDGLGPRPSHTPPPPYTTGTCSFHLKESYTCDPPGSDLYANIQLKDGAGVDIGDSDTSKSSRGSVINSGYSFKSKLPQPLVVSASDAQDMVTFTYGDLKWWSTQRSEGAYCNKPGDASLRLGADCQSPAGDTDSTRDMDCFFPC